MADNHFDLVLVWDNLGGAVRVNSGGKATVTDPTTGAPVPVVQNGQTVTTVTADSNGRVSFVAQQGIVKLTSGGLSENYISPEQATAGAANAAAAQDAQTAAEAARDQAQTAANNATTATAGKVDKASLVVNVRDHGAVGDGVTDDTTAVMAAISKAATAGSFGAVGVVLFPGGTYLCTPIAISPGVTLLGQGVATIKHKGTGGTTYGFPRAIVTSANQPTYMAPDTTGRATVTGACTDIAVEGLILDGNGNHVEGLQFIAVDRGYADRVTIKNCAGGIDLRASRHCAFRDMWLSNISEDGVSVTDQNFAAGVKTSGLRGITENILFERITVIDSQTSNGLGTSSMNAFEMDDGMSEVTFRDCRAINSRGCGFEIHVHTNEYDMADIRFINCLSLNCTPNTGDDRQVAGFMIGQCPSGTYLGRITYDGCTSLGSPNAFAHIPGAETGSIDTITIRGGSWKSKQAEADRNFARSTSIYAGKLFTNFRINGATIGGAVDGYGVYTYATAGELHLTDVTIIDCYSPLYVSHTGGGLRMTAVKMTPGNPVGATTTVCCYILVDDLVMNDVQMVANQANYGASLVRLIGVDRARLSVSIRNSGTTGNNAFTVQDSGDVTLTGSLIRGFTNGLFFAGTVPTSAVSVGNSFKGCTAKYNTVPASLVDAGNAL